jgi:hypothetical protein
VESTQECVRGQGDEKPEVAGDKRRRLLGRLGNRRRGRGEAVPARPLIPPLVAMPARLSLFCELLEERRVFLLPQAREELARARGRAAGLEEEASMLQAALRKAQEEADVACARRRQGEAEAEAGMRRMEGELALARRQLESQETRASERASAALARGREEAAAALRSEWEPRGEMMRKEVEELSGAVRSLQVRQGEGLPGAEGRSGAPQATLSQALRKGTIQRGRGGRLRG